MSVARIELVLRFVGGAVAALGAWDAGRNILVPALPFLSSWTYLTYILLGTSAAVAYVIVFALAPAITTRPFFWLLRRATEMPASDVLVAAVGIIVGLLIGILVSIPLSFLPWYLGNFLPIVASLTLAYLGTTALVSHKREFFQIVRWPREGRVAASAGEGQRVLVDTSSIIGDPNADVDIMLVSLARQLGCPIVTNDYNLNRVAGLQGVKVLNINELANAVKSMVLPGQELSLKIIQEGKELGQGVGYLEDGTMVVVENGRHAIGSDVTVTVSRVLQTVAGRMVFAQQKSGRDGHG